VSHDRWFLDRVATAILAFDPDGQVRLYEGSYAFYAERRPAPPAAAAAPKKSPAPERVKPAAPRKLTFKEKAELAGMEATIEAAEQRVGSLEAALQDPSVFRERAQDVPALVAELDAARAAVDQLYARWEELSKIPAG
jgi:ATP-binding cassette subfamily F protein uup